MLAVIIIYKKYFPAKSAYKMISLSNSIVSEKLLHFLDQCPSMLKVIIYNFFKSCLKIDTCPPNQKQTGDKKVHLFLFLK